MGLGRRLGLLASASAGIPLGWGAPYYPRYCGWGHGGWYHGGGWVSAGYLHNVNVTNTHITNINNITNNYYHNNFAGVNGNRNIPGAVTAAPKSAFTSGAAINKVGMAVPKANLGSGQFMHNADVTPTRSSVLAGSSTARAVPPASATNRGVVTHATPPVGPARFDGHQSPMARTNVASATQGNMNAAHAPVSVPNANQGNMNAARAPGAPSANQGNAPHNVPRPPYAGGTPNSQVARENVPANPASHTTVPQPQTSNHSFTPGNSSVNNHATTNSSPQSTTGGRPRTTSRYRGRLRTTTITRPAEPTAVGSVASVGAVTTCCSAEQFARQQQLIVLQLPRLRIDPAPAR